MPQEVQQEASFGSVSPTQSLPKGKIQSIDDGIEPLPAPNEKHAGTEVKEHADWNVHVSNAAEYLCHIRAECYFPVPPAAIFAIFTNADNAGLFRDIKRSGYRNVIEEMAEGSGTRRVVDVEQIGQSKILWMHTEFSTFLRVMEDDTDPNHLKTHFDLQRSDVLSKFQGSWDLWHEVDEQGRPTGKCKSVLEQDILPRGVPSFLKHVPVLGSALRGVCVRAVQRMVEDIHATLKKADKQGISVDEYLKRMREAEAAAKQRQQLEEQKRADQKAADSSGSADRHKSRFL